METELGLIDADMSWQDKANCRGVDTNLFYLEQGFSKENERKLDIILPLCNSCSVKGKCLSFAVTNQIEHGVWGGLTPKERKYGRRTRVQSRVPGKSNQRVTTVA
jgi:WhiB family transcriptional regulator, redox-sensing transcriptional regulator